MSSTDDIGKRLDRIEQTLLGLQAELAEIRTAVPAPGPAAEEVAGAEAPGARPAPAPASRLAAAWRALERGRDHEAVGHAEDALAHALRLADAEELAAIAAFADAAARHVLEPELSATIAALRRAAAETEPAPVPADVHGVPEWARGVPEPPAAARPEPAPGTAPAPPRAPAAAPAPQAPVRPPAAARARAWAERELTGSRLFALGGGTLMLLGVVFLFVVAANRGWVGPGLRVVLGAVASGVVLIAGLVLRSRYGRLQAALAAVGVGIGGAYATLAAATILYGFLPAWGALLLAAGIASVGGAIALAWSSQLLAGLALVGAAAAPGLVSLDEGISAPAPAFAVVVLAATIAAAAPRRWLWLVAAVGVTALSQVVWLVADSPYDDRGAIAVAAAASLVLLAGAIAWQGTAVDEGLDPAAATMALLGAGVALGAARALLPDDGDEGVALAVAAVVFGAVSVASARRWRDLGWVIGAAALLLVAVATADLLSGRSLSIALAVQSVVLAGLARRLRSPRFELTALAYLGLGVVHVGAVGLEGTSDAGDVPRSAVAALFSLAVASLAVGLLLPPRRGDAAAPGIAEALEPLWDGLVRGRAWIRALLAALALALAAAGTAGLLSGRWLTVIWAAAAALIGLAARAAGERRLVALALPTLGLAVVHAWSVDAQPTTLALERGLDALAPVPSLLALGAACVALAATCRFDQRGIGLLGPIAGPERFLAALGGNAGRVLWAALVHVAAVYGAWAAGLLLVDVSYEWGQVGATSIWAGLGAVVVARGASSGSWAEAAGWGILTFGYMKSVAFDWFELDAAAASTSLIVVSAGLMAAGFTSRWLDTRPAEGRELFSLFVAAVASVSSVVALDRAFEDDRVLGLCVLALAAVLSAFAVPPFRLWRREGVHPWARTLATGYWVLGLASLVFAESALVEFGTARTLTLWAATAAVLALGWRAVEEPRLWIAALALASFSTLGVVAAVTPPDRLVDATAHPGEGVSALLVCVAAAVAVAWAAPSLVVEQRAWLVGGAAAVCLYTVSLAVLEIAERVSGASVETDFQRGHTALSTLLGLGALGVYVVGLARDNRPLRMAGLTLFGLALAKLFLYDLSSLSSITRALSFLALGAVLLAAAFFAERAVRGEPGEQGGSPGPRAV